MNPISVISKATGATTSVNTSSISLNGSSVIVLHAQKEDIAALTRVDNNLVITLHSGEKITIANFFVADEKGTSQLVLEDSQGALWWLEEPSTGIHFEPISSVDELIAGAETSDHMGGAVWPWVLGGLAAVGGAIALGSSGGGGGGGGSDNDSGSATPPNNDEETKDTTPPGAPGNLVISVDGKTVSGTAEPGSSVTVRDADGNVIGTGTTGDDGQFTIDLNTPQTNGETLTANATDAAGNTGPSANVTAPDSTPPLAPVITSIVDGVSPVTGTVANAQSTNDSRPTLNGTGEAGATITIYDGDAPIGSTTVAADGSWSFRPNGPLPEGSHTFTVTATDPAGNTGVASSAVTIVVDTVLPTISNLNVSNDGTTVTGESEPHAIVTVKDAGGNVIGSATANESGSFSITLTSTRSAGETLALSAVDPAGNLSLPTVALVPSAQQIATPTITAIVDNAPPATGPIADGQAINDTAPTLSGRAEAGAIVTIYDGEDNPIGSTTADDSGDWHFTPDEPLGEGEHALTAIATDAEGNESLTSTPFNLTVDTLAPDAPTITDAVSGATTSDTTPTINGKAEAGAVVTIYDGEDNTIGSTTANDSGDWHFTPDEPLGEGEHTLTAIATDAAGNESPASTIFDLTVDTLPPDAPTITDAVGGATTSDTTPTLNGKAEAGAVVTIFDGEDNPIGSTTADDNGDWHFTPDEPLGEGEHTLTAIATDAAGNESPASTTFDLTVDTLAPDAPTITDAVGGATTSDTTPTINGKAEAGAVVTIFDGEDNPIGSTTADDNGDWHFTPDEPLDEGDHTLTATATDAAGNESPASTTFDLTVDTLAPDAPTITDAVGGATTSDTTPTLNGKAEAGAVVTIFDGEDNPIGSTTADDSGNWHFTPDEPLGEGDHTLTAIATDAAGNESPTSIAFDLTVDTVAPDAPTITDAVGGSTISDTTPTISGKAEAGAVITIFDGEDNPIGSTTADDSGDWHFTPDEPLGEGGHSLTATATDAAGNESPASNAVAFTVDSIAPDAPVITEINDAIGIFTGPLEDGQSTDDPRPVVSGTAEAGSTITIYVNDISQGTVTADEFGAWSWHPELGAPLKEGENRLNFTATDAVGNVGDRSETTTIILDTTPPSEPSDLQVSDNGTTLTGTADPGSTIVVRDAGGNPLGSGLVGEGGSFSVTIAPAQTNGETLVVLARDDAGNFSDNINITAPTTGLPDVPEITDIIDSVGIHTGNLNDGQSTDDRLPEIRGKGEAGSTVTLYDNDEILDTVLVNGEGEWTIVLTDELLDGPHAFTVSATNANGTGGTSAPITIVVDTVAPDAPTITDAVGGATTSDTTPTINGKAEAGAVVTIYDGEDNPIGSTTADDSGDWHFTPDEPLDEGEHTLTATATDAAGNESPASTTFDLTVDTLAPDAPTITDAVGGATTSDTTPTINGKAEAGAVVTIFDGEDNPIGSTTADDNGDWHFTPDEPLDEGDHTLTATATDAAGNESPASTTFDLTVDTLAPDAPTITDAVGGATTSDTTPTLNGKAEAGAVVTIFDGEDNPIGSTTADDNGDWHFTPDEPLGEGEHELTAIATDAAGNNSPTSTAFDLTVDTLAPDAPTITDAVGGATTSDTTPTINGKAEAGSVVTIYDGEDNPLGSTTADDSGDWHFTPDEPLGEGEHELTAVATDAAGNESPASTTFELTVDTVAPAAPTITSIVDNLSPTTGPIVAGVATNDPAPTLNGRAEAGAIVTIFDGEDNPIGSTTADDNGDWHFTPDEPLGEGDHELTAVATDAAGNVGGASPFVAITIDTTAPDAPTGLSVSPSGTRVTGSAEPGSTVTITDADGTVLGSATADGTGSFTATITPAQTNGESLLAFAQDKAGNVGEAAGFSASTTGLPDVPTIETVTDNVSPITGPLENGQSTNETLPLLSGKAQAGATVTVYDKGAEIGTTTADDDGVWNFTPTVPLTEGQHVFTATATNASGTGGFSEPRSIVVDTIAPDAPTATVSADGSTISGIAEAGSTVTITLANGTTVTTAANDSGSYSYTFQSKQTDGEQLFVTATDAAGNPSPRTQADAPDLPLSANNNVIELALTSDAPVTTTQYGDYGFLLVGALGNLASVLGNDTAQVTFTVGNGSTADVKIDADATGIVLSLLSSLELVVQQHNSANDSWTTVVDTQDPRWASLLTFGDSGISLNLDALAAGTYRVVSYNTSLLATGSYTSLNVSVIETGAGTVNGDTTHSGNVILDDDPVSGSDTASGGALVTQVTNAQGTVVPVTADGAVIQGTYGTLTLYPDGSYTYTLFNTSASVIGHKDSFSYTLSDGTISDTASLVISLGEGAVTGQAVAVDNAASLLFDTEVATIDNGTWSQKGYTVVNLGLGDALDVGVLDDLSNPIVFNVEQGTTRSLTLQSEVGGIALASKFDLYIYKFNDETQKYDQYKRVEDWLEAPLFGGKSDELDLTLDGGKYLFLLDTTSGLSVLTGYSLKVLEDHVYSVTSVSASTSGEVLDNDIAPPNTVVSAVNGVSVAASGDTVIVGQYGTLTINAQGHYTYTLKSGVGADSISTPDSFIYTITAPNGDKDTASLNVTPAPRGLDAVDDVSAAMTVTSIQDTSGYSDTSVGTASWSSSLGKTTGNGSGTFVVDEGSALKDIVLTFKASSTLLLGSADISWEILEGTTSIRSGTTSASMLLGGSPGTVTLSGLELDAGTYTLKFTGSETGLVGQITVTPSVSGTLVDLSDYLSTAGHAVSGNIFDGSDSAGAMDQLSSVGTTLSITDANGVTTTLDPYTTSNATASIHGQYGTLTIGVDGTYSYTLNPGVSLSTITEKETFNYTLTSSNGQTANATLTVDMAPQFVSSGHNDVITGTAYADTAIYHLLNAASNTGGNGSDVWSNFSLQQGDKIDIHELLVGWNGQTSTLGNYLSVTTSGNDTVISIDRDGASGQTYQSTTLITLENVHTTLDELIEQHHIITH